MNDTDPRIPMSRLARWTLAGAGVLAVVLGGIGVFVPGLPTTVFLLVATYCFARSCPWLEERLLRGRLFSPYMKFVDGGEPMPYRTRLTVLSAMWLSVGVSLAFLFLTDRLPPWLAALIVGTALIGTLAIHVAGHRRDRVQNPCNMNARRTTS